MPVVKGGQNLPLPWMNRANRSAKNWGLGQCPTPGPSVPASLHPGQNENDLSHLTLLAYLTYTVQWAIVFSISCHVLTIFLYWTNVLIDVHYISIRNDKVLHFFPSKFAIELK